MFSITNYLDFDLGHTDSVIHALWEGPKTTSDLLKIRSRGIKMASPSTYVSSARKRLRKTGYTISCTKKGKIGSQIFTYQIIPLTNAQS